MTNKAMKEVTLQALNEERKGKHYKIPANENFLQNLNAHLADFEQSLYSGASNQHPFVFVFGLPRSGTTLTAQILAYGLNTGYINNLAARFWLAPLTGLKLSAIALPPQPEKKFESNYANTSGLADLHEFGYFWRHWLKLEGATDFRESNLKQKDIDWAGLSTTLAEINSFFNRPVVMKNIFGAYFLDSLSERLPKVLWVCVERDPVDVAISILSARQKFYGDTSMWWSTFPTDYEKYIGLSPIEQIAGQVVSLNNYYQKICLTSKFSENIIRVKYDDMTSAPREFLKAVNDRAYKLYGATLGEIDIPEKFETRQHKQDEALREEFTLALQRISKLY